MFNKSLGISHILLLGYLHENEKSSPSKLAAELGLTRPTITHISEKLVKENLAIQLQDEKDRRITLLNITDIGKDILKLAHEKGHELREVVF